MGMHFRRETELEGHDQVGLMVRSQQGNHPTFVLYAARKAEARSSEEIRVYRDVILGSALREKLPVHFPMAKFQSDLVFRREPVVGHYGFTLCSSSYPGSDCPTTVRVSIDVLIVPVEIATRLNVVVHRAG